MAVGNKTVRKNFSQTIKNVVTRKASDTIILKYLNNSRDYKMGQEQTIASDHIVIGRDSTCEVRYSDKYDTVSRIHASISKRGEDWELKNLSKSNPTLINGAPVKKSWYLSSGDVIQFSFEGPKIQFNVPSPSEKKSIPWSVVIKEQVIRPYKKYVVAASVFFALVISSLVYVIVKQGQTIEQQITDIASIKELTEGQAEAAAAKLDSLQEIYQNQIEREKKANRPIGEKIAPYFNDIWYIYALGVELEFEGETEYVDDYEWSGTGFLLDDGRLITAGHVVRPWLFGVDDDDQRKIISNVLDNGLGRVRADFVAISPDGKKINFSTQNVHSSNQRTSRDLDFDGNTYSLKEVDWEHDWAWIQTKYKGKLSASYTTSSKLDISNKLHILGYPYSLGISEKGMTPLYSSSDVSSKGLSDGMIQLTNRNFEHGNSGGPALFEENGKLKVVGIVSSGIGSSLGFLVPISKVK
jgi:pSer/pThr/pTyr-binding forkhead associated (FHA) protein